MEERQDRLEAFASIMENTHKTAELECPILMAYVDAIAKGIERKYPNMTPEERGAAMLADLNRESGERVQRMINLPFIIEKEEEDE